MTHRVTSRLEALHLLNEARKVADPIQRGDRIHYFHLRELQAAARKAGAAYDYVDRQFVTMYGDSIIMHTDSDLICVGVHYATLCRAIIGSKQASAALKKRWRQRLATFETKRADLVKRMQKNLPDFPAPDPSPQAA